MIMIIDGEILVFKCKDCENKFSHMIGYGPFCPNSNMRRDSLRENPPICPKCNSKNVSQTWWSKLIHPC